jgi:hypothetical protein
MGSNRETLNYVIAISDICETDNAKDFTVVSRTRERLLNKLKLLRDYSVKIISHQRSNRPIIWNRLKSPFMSSLDFRRLPMGSSAKREKYSDLYEALRVRDNECMK